MKAAEIIDLFLAAADAFNGPYRFVRPAWMAEDAEFNADIARMELARARRMDLYGPPLPRRSAAVSATALLEHVTHLELTRLQTAADKARQAWATSDRLANRAYRAYETARDAVDAYREEITRLRDRIEQWASETA